MLFTLYKEDVCYDWTIVILNYEIYSMDEVYLLHNSAMFLNNYSQIFGYIIVY